MPTEKVEDVKREKVGEVVQEFVEATDHNFREIEVSKKQNGRWDVTATYNY